MLNIKKINIVVLASMVIFAQLLVSCSGNDESVFLDKIKASVAKEGPRCYSVDDLLNLLLLGKKGGEQFLAVRSGSVMNFYKKKQENGRKMIKKLAKAGYIIMNANPKKLKYNFQMYDGYKLTKKGQKYILWDKGVCVGRRVVTGIEEYTEPSSYGGMTFSKVTYKYKMNLNNIASDLDLGKEIKEKLPGVGKEIFIKTNKGWRIK